jgi:large subunit ribosomal protein L4e
MKIPVLSVEKIANGDVELPAQFSEPVSTHLIRRAVIALQLSRQQPYGAFPEAGMRPSAKISRRRRNYKGAYGKGISRVPRKTMSRSGLQFAWRGALAPGTVGGRRAHPPKAYAADVKKINRKEKKKAIRSALAATVAKSMVAARNHVMPDQYPFVVEDAIATLSKTKDLIAVLHKLGLVKELSRTSVKRIRAGKGKMRGRKYDRKIGPLIVVAERCALFKSAGNIPGLEVVTVSSVNAEMLAPGAVPGRLTLYTKGAIEKLRKDKLFM